MKPVLSFLLLALVSAALAADHPRVYFSAADLPRLRQKVAEVKWAGDIVRGWHRDVDALVERHVSDPEFIVSHLQMHWEEGKRYTHFYTDGNFIPRREGNAKYPTIRPPYARSWGDGIKSGDWKDDPPYSDGRLRAKNPAESPTGDGLIPLERTGQAYENLNDYFLRLAYWSAIIYQLEGDERYAKFAADIVWTLVRGGSQQEQVNPGNGGNNGFLSWETLGDSRHYWAIPLIWDMLYDYFHNEYFDSDEFKHGIKGQLWAPGHSEGKEWALERFHVFFEKMIDNKLMRGGGLEGNWNMNEQESAMLYALALDGDDKYADGKGRKYYVKQLVKGPTTASHGAYMDVLRANIDETTGLWPEAPGGYGQGSIAQLVKFGFIYWKNGLDLLSRDPLLFKASRAMPQMVFPNGYIANIGDSSYHRIWTDQLELMAAYAKEKGDTALLSQSAAIIRQTGGRNLRSDIALFFYLDELPEIDIPELSRVSYAPCYPAIVERNMSSTGDGKDALAFSLAGYSTKMGHRHPNGLTIELCGRGEVLAPDIGAGGDYWCRETHRYYRHVAAHNTVAPNGRGADDNLEMTFDHIIGEPRIEAGAYVAESRSPLRQFAQVESHFRGKDGFDCRQQRTVGIVRTTKTTGYFVDVFRSKVEKGEEKYHDYIYHNVGEWGVVGSALRADRGRVGDAPLPGFGYEYFKTLGMWRGGGEWSGRVDYGRGIATGIHLATSEGDEIYQLEGPKAFRHYSKRVGEKPCPAVLLRRKGEAWQSPFVAVYEPFGDGVDEIVGSVSAEAVKGAPSVTAVTVAFKDNPDRKDVVLVADGEKAAFAYGGIKFKTTFAVVSYRGGRVVNVYAGDGTSNWKRKSV